MEVVPPLRFADGYGAVLRGVSNPGLICVSPIAGTLQSLRVLKNEFILNQDEEI